MGERADSTSTTRDAARGVPALRAAAGRRLLYARTVSRPSAVRTSLVAFTRDLRGRRAYRTLTKAELRATRRTDTAFVFGSGRSLLEITRAEWARIAACDTISMREFPRQRWVRADYHVTGEVDDLESYAERLRENPFYAETVFVVQEGWLAEMGNELVGRRLLRTGSRVFRYRRVSRGVYAPPSRDPARLVHGFNSVTGVVNFAIAMGFRQIVLAGVELDNKGYFWLDEGETRSYEKPGITSTSMFPNARATVGMLGRWRELLAAEGVELFVASPRSLLAETGALPVFRWEEHG